MGYGIGTVLSLVVTLFARFVGLDRDRAFYPTIMIVIAHYYVLFALIGGTTKALLIEAGVMLLFIATAVFGFRRNLWLVVAAMVAHGIFDFFHSEVITNEGVPPWWPAFCLSYDIGAGACLSFLLLKDKIGSKI